jgi:hypothetical protein
MKKNQQVNSNNITDMARYLLEKFNLE